MRLDHGAPTAAPILALGIFVLASSCGGDDNGVQPGGTRDGGLGAPVFLAHFDSSRLPEGLWGVSNGGPIIVSFTALGTLATVTADGRTQPFGSLAEAGAATNSNTLGITADSNGNVYVAVGSFAVASAAIPAPGIYKIAPTGGTGTLFSSAPTMNVPNGLDFIGNALFVADSEGAIYTIDPAGTASVWSDDPLLAPDMTACSGAEPAPVGANGIVHDANNVYVTNSNHGWIVRIPIMTDGRAGVASTIIGDCTLAGADGMVLDTRDGSLLVAVNVQNKIVRVTTDGLVSTVASGPPLDFPASVIIDAVGGVRRLLFTNLALVSGSAGNPGLLALPIP